jgi:hypothetical protein
VSLDHLFEKRDTCLVCDSSKKLICPSCQANEQCQFFFPTDCTECSRAYCAPIDAASTAVPASTGTTTTTAVPSVGAIAGGVAGGVTGIAVLTYLVWRYFIKTKRQPLEEETWEPEAEPSVEAEKSFSQRRDQRSSTHTVHSIASTVLTRASNIIQIAYIPGVTNRANAASPGLLVPPVPPVPLALSQASSPAGTEEQHFFMPGDLRDSTYSAMSGYTDRTSYARTSYAPRSSVASTIYGKNAVIVATPQTGMRAKPEMVSVKSKNSSGQNTPPVPSVDFEKYNGNHLHPASPTGSTFSVGSTFLNNASAHTAMPARAQVIRVGSGNSKKTSLSTVSTPEETSNLLHDNGRESVAVTLIDDSPTVDQGPFSDPPNRTDMRASKTLSAVMEESTRRSSQRDSNGALKSRERSPFGDEHATQD